MRIDAVLVAGLSKVGGGSSALEAGIFFGYEPCTQKRPDSADEHERQYDPII